MRALLLLLVLPCFANAQINPVFVAKSNLSYPKLEASGDGLFGFEKDGKFGYMDKNEKVIIPAVYEYANTTYKSIPSFSKGLVSLYKDGKYGLLDKTGKTVIPFEYDYVNPFATNPSFVTLRKKADNKNIYGVASIQHKIIIPVEYDDLQTDSFYVAVKKNSKWGLMDVTGKLLLPLEYTALTVFAREKVCKAEKDGKYGFIDLKGNWLFEKVKSVYTLLGCYYGMIQCQVSSKYGFLDLKGNEVIMTRYDVAGNFENHGLARVGKKSPVSASVNLYGYIDKKGGEIIPLKFESLGFFYHGLASAKDPETNRYGFLDKTGKWIIKPAYLDVTNFDNTGGAWVKMTDGKWHYIDKTGKDFGIFTDASYKSFNADGYAAYEHSDYPYVMMDKTGKVIKKIEDCSAVYNFSEGMAGFKCSTSGKYGFIDLNGNKIIPCEYDGFTGFADGVSRVSKTIDGKTKYGYIDNKGNVILPVAYENAQGFRNGWGLVKNDGNYFFVDRSGNLKEPPRKYDELNEFRSGFALGKIKGTDNNPHTFYYINPQLKEEFFITAWQAYLFWENVAVVSTDNKTYELMNKKGEIFKKLEGVETLIFCNNGMLAVREKGKWGYVNEKGDMMIKPKYDTCDSFKDGFARVKLNSKWGIIDKSGTEITEPKYENIIPCENGVFIFFDKWWGIMDKTGKILVPTTLYSITIFEKDKALARLGKTFSIIKSPLAK